MVEQLVATFVAVLLILLGIWWYSDTEAGGDALTIADEGIISHLWNARERGACMATAAVAFHARELVGAVTQWPPWALLHVLLQIILLFGIFAVFFWIWFDIRINRRRGKAMYYIGINAKSDTWATRVFRSENPGRAFLLTKIGLFSAVFVAYHLATWWALKGL